MSSTEKYFKFFKNFTRDYSKLVLSSFYKGCANEYITHIKKYVTDCDLVVWDDIGTKIGTEFEIDKRNGNFKISKYSILYGIKMQKINWYLW